MLRTAPALALVLLLAGCAGPRWTKPGVSQTQAEADYSECNEMAQAANRRDDEIEADILASRGHDWQQTGTMATHKAVFAAEAYHRTDDLMHFCMQAKGYAESGD